MTIATTKTHTRKQSPESTVKEEMGTNHVPDLPVDGQVNFFRLFYEVLFSDLCVVYYAREHKRVASQLSSVCNCFWLFLTFILRDSRILSVYLRTTSMSR